jgi:tetratricopeptide (TPR) repeat protein
MKQILHWNIRVPYWYALIAAAVAALAYLNTLSNGFVSDDLHLILQHPFVQHFSDWPRIFTAGHYEGHGGYRPLTTFSFALNYLIGGRNPVGYHLFNIALHALNSALVFLLLSRILATRLAAFIGALVFAVHPIHTEAVAWISGRAELLAALFFFGAWLLHLRSRHVTGIWSTPRILSAVALFAALLSKENALVFPIVVAAADILISRWQSHWDALTGLKHWQRAARLYLPSLAAIGLYFLVRAVLYHRSIWRSAANIQFIDNPLAHVPAFTRVLTAIKIQLEYLWLLIWPRDLCADYSFNSIPLVTKLNDPSIIIALTIFALLFGLAAYSFSRGGRFWFGILFYFVTVAPVANIFAFIGTIKAERFLYLPSFGLCFVATVAVARFLQTRSLHESRWIRTVSVCGYTAAMFAAFFATWERNEIWRDERTLWQSVVAVAPNNLKAQLQIGQQALASGERNRAIVAFRRAFEIDSGSEDAVINLSAALMQDRQYVEATRRLEDAVRRFPNRAALHLNLGLAYLAQNQPASGINELRRACELEPTSAEMRFNLALAFSRTGDPDSAIREYRKAIELNPNYAEAWNGLGAALLKMHRNDDARDAFQRALALRPGYSEAIYNLTLIAAPR